MSAPALYWGLVTALLCAAARWMVLVGLGWWTVAAMVPALAGAVLFGISLDDRGKW